ncbi:hypothetical protein JF541_01335 [Marinobacter hydrocarbonoclasticus]|uniref:hypothetical protein n=1 Tax=Marinobacter nauticus TaxID=2743 RepID=UPI001A8F293D|nr:hypothetical protein [Marinobacter nauticus]MBN8237774.1 hypothetical protein [Marinobacter nauticus]
MPTQIERVLILAKTYPSPSASYVETSCVAGITESGEMRRLYPVPFRLLADGQQFQKWQWIDVRTEKARADHRPESHRVFVDSIECRHRIDTRGAWSERRLWLEKIPRFTSIDEVNSARETSGTSMALLTPSSIDSLEIQPARNKDWTEAEKVKLIKNQIQGSLFTEQDANEDIHQLQKVPFDFYYNVTYQTPEGPRQDKLKIIDWEAGVLYRKCVRSHGAKWQAPFRAKLEEDLFQRDLQLLIGNQHRFQNQWLIISLIYPPKIEGSTLLQQPLF